MIKMREHKKLMKYDNGERVVTVLYVLGTVLLGTTHTFDLTGIIAAFGKVLITRTLANDFLGPTLYCCAAE